VSESAVDQGSHNVASHWEATASHSPCHIGAYGDNQSDFVSAAATTQPHSILPSSRVGPLLYDTNSGSDLLNRCVIHQQGSQLPDMWSFASCRQLPVPDSHFIIPLSQLCAFVDGNEHTQRGRFVNASHPVMYHGNISMHGEHSYLPFSYQPSMMKERGKICLNKIYQKILSFQSLTKPFNVCIPVTRLSM
jgi:hypothetical protein